MNIFDLAVNNLFQTRNDAFLESGRVENYQKPKKFDFKFADKEEIE